MTRRFVLFAALLFAIARPASPQTVAVAQLTGALVDDSGAALPGVEVTVSQTSTGMTRFVTTGSRGEDLRFDLARALEAHAALGGARSGGAAERGREASRRDADAGPVEHRCPREPLPHQPQVTVAAL